MNLSLRERDILDTARASGTVMVEDLAAAFDVTVQTIRRDLTALADAGLLERVHGGAVLPSGIRNIAYAERRQVNAAAKEAMARAAAADIADGSALYLGIGTSTEALARALGTHDGLMVVTANLNVAEILSAHPRCEVLLTGGRPRPEDGGLTGPVAARMLAGFRFDIAVLGCSALSAPGGVFDYDMDEVTVSQAALAHSRAGWLLADHSKFSRHAPVHVTDLSALDRFYTDTLPPGGADQAADWGTRGRDLRVNGDP